MEDKIGIKQANVEIKEDETIILHYEELDEQKQINLNKFLKTLNGDISISIKPYKFRKPPERKPIFKYGCECGTEVKTTIENLDAVCEKCNTKFFSKE